MLSTFGTLQPETATTAYMGGGGFMGFGGPPMATPVSAAAVKRASAELAASAGPPKQPKPRQGTSATLQQAAAMGFALPPLPQQAEVTAAPLLPLSVFEDDLSSDHHLFARLDPRWRRIPELPAETAVRPLGVLANAQP